MAAEKVYDQMRVHLAAVLDPELTIRSLAEQVRAGRPIDFRVLAALDGQDALLHQHGLTVDVLNREAVKALSGAGTGSTDALRATLERVRERLLATPATDDRVTRIRQQAIELADANIDRMAGRRTDTFSRHPDYAEVGRIVSIAELLEATRQRAAAPAADVLTW
jgi:hypothetical protein